MHQATIDITRSTPAETAKAPPSDEAYLTEFTWYILLTVISAWGIAILTFGLPGLIIPALLLVPVIFALLLLITAGG
ncbi:MAG: hypothetical protein AAFY59_02305 [Pseudomonadota bacterium]